jgi:2,3,4,5-tetrahydropyridine-2-carboxylate N-succinyltransferase
MNNYNSKVEELWQIRDNLVEDQNLLSEARLIIDNILQNLDAGNSRIAEKKDDVWIVNEWLKKAILLHFKISDMRIFSGECTRWYDKVSLKFDETTNEQEFKTRGCRIVPGAYVRVGVYIAERVVVMPSFINIGAYIDEGTMIDTWASIGSCAQIGKNCHISGGVGIGGVLEPVQSTPVIIEDNCFIGARSEIVEGVIVEEGAVISMGVFIGSSTKIVYRDSGQVIYGKIPAYSVVVPGTLPDARDPSKPSLSCAVIIKTVDASTRSKTSINELLRG